MLSRVAILLSLPLAACVGPLSQSPSATAIAFATLNAELADYAKEGSLSASRFEMHSECQGTLVTRWSSSATSRKGFASATTETQVNFASIKVIEFTGARRIAAPSGVQLWDAVIRIVLSREAPMKTTVVMASDMEERSTEYNTENADIAVPQDATAADSSVRLLVKRLQEIQAMCNSR